MMRDRNHCHDCGILLQRMTCYSFQIGWTSTYLKLCPIHYWTRFNARKAS